LSSKQVEGAEHRGTVVAKGTDQAEHREPAVVADDGLAVDQAGARRQRHDGRHDERESRGEIVAVAGVEPHAAGVAPRQDAEAVMLDFVEPVGTGRRGFGRRRQAGFDKAGRAVAML
jgi:hypothetical protein